MCVAVSGLYFCVSLLDYLSSGCCTVCIPFLDYVCIAVSGLCVQRFPDYVYSVCRTVCEGVSELISRSPHIGVRTVMVHLDPHIPPALRYRSRHTDCSSDLST
jgi:hypothetical protein